ncbi:MAG: efflux RND transporter periplasmic adaptor subunit [Pseudomonadota bacterium]
MRLTSILAALGVSAAVALWILTGPSDNGSEKVDAETASGEQASNAPIERVSIDVVAIKSDATELESAIVLRGRTEASRTVEVVAQTEGLIVSTPLRKGAEVSAGETLCEINMADRPARIAEAEAKLAQAQIDVDASGKLKERGFAAATTHAANLAELEAAKANLEEWRIDLGRTTMTAPFDGVLETDTAELGALLQRGDVCATVVALDPIKVVGFAPERLVASLQAGQDASAHVINGATIDMIVTFVAQSADPDTRTFRVEAQASNPDGLIRDGMTAELTVPLKGARGHLLPHSALTLNNTGDIGVRLEVDGEARFAPISILRDSSDGVWVSGLPEAANVIVVGQEFVTDGAAVTAQFADAPTN